VLINIKKIINTLIFILFLVLFLLFSIFSIKNNYLLFHTISEMFSIIIGYTIFTIAWVSRNKYEINKSFIFLGISYFFVSTLDLLHTLNYKGIDIFKTDRFYSTELWIATRYVESISLFIFSLIFNKVKRLWAELTFFIYFIITLFITLSILEFKIFPTCFIEGKGLTDFKIISEYIISLILLFSILFLTLKEEKDKKNISLIRLSVVFTVLSELSFTLYNDVYSITNAIGHIFKLISFYFIYKSMVRENIDRPLNFIYDELKNNINMLKESNKKLQYINDVKTNFFL